MNRQKHEHWRVTVETSGEHIVSIEPEMLAGREISEADEEAIRTAARHLLAFIGSPADKQDIPVPDAVIGTIWKAAMTVAANIVIKHENDANDDDAPMRVIDELSSCVRGIKEWMEVDEVYLEQLRPMVRAVLPPSPSTHSKASEIIAAIRHQLEINVQIAEQNSPEGPIVDGKRVKGLTHSQDILAQHIRDHLSELELVIATPAPQERNSGRSARRPRIGGTGMREGYRSIGLAMAFAAIAAHSSRLYPDDLDVVGASYRKTRPPEPKDHGPVTDSTKESKRARRRRLAKELRL